MARIIVWVLAALIILLPSGAFATYQFFPANATIAGGDDLEAIDCDGGVGPPAWEACADGDAGFVVTSGQDVCIYVMDDDATCGSTSAESPCPLSIQPDDRSDAAANQCWVLVTLNGAAVAGDGIVTGTISPTEDADGATITAAGCKGHMYYNNTKANDYIIPANVAGLNCCFYEDSAHAVTIIPNDAANDRIFYLAEDCGEDKNLVGPGTQGSFICLHAKDGTDWMAWGSANTWTCEP